MSCWLLLCSHRWWCPQMAARFSMSVAPPWVFHSCTWWISHRCMGASQSTQPPSRTATARRWWSLASRLLRLSQRGCPLPPKMIDESSVSGLSWTIWGTVHGSTCDGKWSLRSGVGGGRSVPAPDSPSPEFGSRRRRVGPTGCWARPAVVAAARAWRRRRANRRGGEVWRSRRPGWRCLKTSA